MARPRLQFQAILESLGAEKVYRQPPINTQIQYPCIMYEPDAESTQHADNKKYRHALRYTVTVIHRDPDNAISKRVSELPLCSFNRFFAKDSLNHDVYTVYF